MSPTPSDIVYLFGDRFAPREKLLSPSESVPCGTAKVQRRELAHEMLHAAFAHLRHTGSIGLSLGQRKTLILRSEAVLVTPLNTGAHIGGLEQAILESLTGDAGKNYADEVVGRAIGEERIDPWAAVIDAGKEHLRSLGYLVEEERSGLGKLIPGRTYAPTCEKIAALQVQIPAVQALLRELEPPLANRLREDIKKGVTSRYQTREIDADE